MKYNIKYKKIGSWFWTTKTVTGHGLDFADDIIFQQNVIVQKIRKPLDAMILYFDDGVKIERIPEWSKYTYKLDKDWKLAQKKQMDDEAGVDSKVK